jgi:hypothetical protein
VVTAAIAAALLAVYFAALAAVAFLAGSNRQDRG